jgi:hypothetical protein
MRLKTLLAIQGGLFGTMVAGSMVMGSILWPYTINAWLVFVDKPATMVWWHGAIAGVFPPIGFLSLPASLITYVAMLFL